MRCQMLFGSGRRCSHEATHVVRYHGDGEIYGYFSDKHRPWAKVYACEKHADKSDRKMTAQERREP